MMSVFSKVAKDTCVLAVVALTGVGVTAAQDAATARRVACVGGVAGNFPCEAVDLLSHLPNGTLGPGAAESLDLWGWTDPQTGAEYALAAMDDRTAFVDVSEPVTPRVVGYLPHSGSKPGFWRDVKVYADHAYIVADLSGMHGLQVFDLTRLRGQSGPPVVFTMDAHYTGFGSAHNVAINEATGFAYVVGATFGESCGGGLHMINLRVPDDPQFAGCHAHVGTGRSGTGYTHDVQCVVYDGPDADYTGREICIAANETALSISDVTDKSRPVVVSKAEYPLVKYAHQGWLTEDRRYFFLGDELDERDLLAPARTLLFDVADLDDPVFVTDYRAGTQSIDHNLYIRGTALFQANYTAGLRILDIQDPEAPVEIGFFDTTPSITGIQFEGAWSVYPYFHSGTLLVSSIAEGLFVLQSTHPSLSVGVEAPPEVPRGLRFRTAFPNPFEDVSQVTIDVLEAGHLSGTLVDLLGRPVRIVFDSTVGPGPAAIMISGDGLPAGHYVLRLSLNGRVFSRMVTRR